MFSTVFLVQVASSDAEAACKVLRNNELMRRAGEKEMAILKELETKGQHNHIVRLLDSLDMEQHLILVFERMSMNLRETLDRFGKRIGINFEGVRAYASQLFSALARLRQMGIVHADLKPDNILVSADLRRVALADFGSAFRLTDPDAGQITPYLVSRYYRAPEIILGLTYGCEVDVWALGATLFELATGSLLFTGTTNNDMLKQQQRALGPFPAAMLRKHIRAYTDKLELEPHFDEEQFRFKQHDADPVTGKIVRKLVKYKEPERHDPATVLGRLKANKGELDVDLVDLSELIMGCLSLDPAHRLDPTKAGDVALFKKVKMAT